MVEVKAYLRYLRMSPRKTRLVVDAVKGMMVADALDKLPFIKKHATRPIIKLIKSAVANAENNFKLKSERLFIKDLRADVAPTLKRLMPRAHGRGAPIKKRSTHLTVVLGDVSQKQEKGKLKITSKTELKNKETKLKTGKVEEKKLNKKEK